MVVYNAISAKQLILQELENPQIWQFKNKNTFNEKDLQKINYLNKLKQCVREQMVFQVNKQNKYLIKLIVIETISDMETYMSELLVGLLPLSSQFGVNVHAFIRPNLLVPGSVAMFIMDHVTMGNDSLKSMTLYQYRKSTMYNHSDLIRLLHKTLISFYTITNGYHADLHENNIMVLLKKNKLVDVKIIDYGMFTPFTKKQHQTKKTFTEFMNLTQKTFNNMNSHNSAMFQGDQVKYHPSGRPVRSNKSLLKNMLGNLQQLNKVKNVSIK
tara:strand:- start:2627 stop:3436 length:810 start_codon:yes stop_codon:yes gene_type:complete